MYVTYPAVWKFIPSYFWFSTKRIFFPRNWCNLQNIIFLLLIMGAVCFCFLWSFVFVFHLLLSKHALLLIGISFELNCLISFFVVLLGWVRFGWLGVVGNILTTFVCNSNAISCSWHFYCICFCCCCYCYSALTYCYKYCVVLEMLGFFSWSTLYSAVIAKFCSRWLAVPNPYKKYFVCMAEQSQYLTFFQWKRLQTFISWLNVDT